MSDAIVIENAGCSTVIRFNRPRARNPLSVDVLEALIGLLGRQNDPGGRVVFTGSGDCFASGADLREIALVTGATARGYAERGQRLMSLVAGLDTTAAVNGLCFGGAFDLALACRRRIAAPGAVFCHPGAGLGIMTGWGGTQRLPRLVGEAKALEIFLTGKRVTAAEALACGLVEAVADDPLRAALETERR